MSLEKKPKRKKSKKNEIPLNALRHQARHYALQALYQWQMTRAPLADIDAQFMIDYDMSNVDVEYFRALLHEIPTQVEALDDLMRPHMVDRAPHELTPIEQAMLRIGIYELAHRLDTQYRIVIDEAVILNKKFGAEDAYKFVNAVLDKLAKQLRPAEYGQ